MVLWRPFLTVFVELALILVGSARADDNSNALSLIENTAEKICGSLSTQGNSSSINAKGEIEAALNGLLKKLGDVGIRGSGEITSQSYVGVLQKDLPVTLEGIRECKLKVFDSLKDTLLPKSSSGVEKKSANIGWLQPGDEPTPVNSCSRPPPQVGEGPKNELTVIVGDSAFVFKGSGRMTAIQVGDCQSISIAKDQNGLSISAQIYEPDGEYMGEIENNKYSIDGNKKLVTQISGDFTALIVHDSQNNELLNVKYLNPSTARIRGIFSCPTPRRMTVAVTNSGIKIPGNNFFSNNCLVGGRVGIMIQ